MYKKLLLATAIAGLTGNVVAATVTGGTAPIHTKEGLALAGTAAATTANAEVVVGAEYAVGDIITFTYSSALDATFNSPGTINCDDQAGSVDGAGTNATGDIVLSKLSQSTTAVNYRVTGVTGTHSGEVACSSPQATLDEDALSAAGSATLTVSAQTANGVAMDSWPAAVTIATAVDQFGAPVITAGQVIDDQIDVTKERKQLVGAANSATSNAVQFEVTPPAMAGTAGTQYKMGGTDLAAGAATEAVAAIKSVLVSTNYEIVSSAGWAWADSDVTAAATGTQLGNLTIADLANGAAIATAIDAGGTKVTMGDTDTDVEAVTIKLNKTAAALTIPVTSFTLNSSYIHDTDKTVSGFSTSAGAFSLNATSVTAYSMPFSSGVIPFLYVSNGSNVAGDVTATITTAGTVSSVYTVGSVAAYTNANVFNDLKAAVEAAGDVFPTDGRGDITVTITSSNTEVLASYYKDGDRLGLETSESLNP